MLRKKESHNSTIMLTLFGAFVGASVALLFAPQTGEKTRRQLKKYGKKAGSRAQRFVGDIAESMDSALGDILDYSQDGLEKGKKLSDRARVEILDVLDAGKKYIEEERTKLDKIFR
jgi:gas vesicle protein